MSTKEATTESLKQYLKLNLLFVQQGRAVHLFKQNRCWAYIDRGLESMELRNWWKLRSRSVSGLTGFHVWNCGSWNEICYGLTFRSQMTTKKGRRERESGLGEKNGSGRKVRASHQLFLLITQTANSVLPCWPCSPDPSCSPCCPFSSSWMEFHVCPIPTKGVTSSVRAGNLRWLLRGRDMITGWWREPGSRAF